MKKIVKCFRRWYVFLFAVAVISAVCIGDPDHFLYAAEHTEDLQEAGPADQEIQIVTETDDTMLPDDRDAEEKEIHIQVIFAADEEVPLAEGMAGYQESHGYCIVHDILLVASAVILILCFRSRKMHRARILRLTEELAFERQKRGR